MKLSINGLYNLGKSEMSNEKVYMTGEDIVDKYQSGTFKGLGNVQKGKLRKIARRILFK
jgi:hypothetical protein